MKEMVMKMDCVVEIHDARIPFSGRNPLLQQFSGLKPNVLVLNKMDLIPVSKLLPNLLIISLILCLF